MWWHVNRDPEMGTGMAAAACKAEDFPIAVHMRPGKAHIIKRRCAYVPRYRNWPHRHRMRSCSPGARGGRGAVVLSLRPAR